MFNIICHLRNANQQSGTLFENKKKELLTWTKTQINPENIMLSERSQSQKAMCYVIPFVEKVQNRQIHSRKEMSDYQGQQREEMKMAMWFLIVDDENVKCYGIRYGQ